MIQPATDGNGTRSDTSDSPEFCQLNIRCISKEERAAFREWCAARGYSMERAALALIRWAVEEDPVLEDAENRSLTRV